MSGSFAQSTLGALSFQYRVCGIVERLLCLRYLKYVRVLQRLLWVVSDGHFQMPKVLYGLKAGIERF